MKHLLSPCKYLQSPNWFCPHKIDFEHKVAELQSQGKDVQALQPRCPRDAQRNKRGLNVCWCYEEERLC